MEKAVKLNEAFHNFTQASKSLETYYGKLQKRVRYLTEELEKKNTQLSGAISEVKESKDYLQAVLQSIGEAIIVLDSEDRITIINRAAEKLLGADVQRVTNKMFHQLNISIEDNNSGTRLTVDGRVSDVIVSRSTISGPEGAERGFVILVKDITRLKELERQNERNQRLIAMGEMAAKIVHEIRSPLCSIELFSNMLSKDLENTTHSDMANGISTGIKSLNNILTNMLFFAKAQKPSFREVRPSEAVEESVKMLFPLVQIRGIKISKKLSNDAVSGDLELMKQVFMNIIQNSIQAMPDGGILNIKMEEYGEWIKVSVTDSGSGISQENIEKIFDPFFSTKDNGTGLGLAIANKIMQSHGGIIKAFGKEGEGSTFDLCFPKQKVSDSEISAEILYEKAGI